MADRIGMGLQAANQALRFGWYFGLSRVAGWQSRQFPGPPRYKPERPVPTEREVLADLAQLFLRDAMAVRDGIFPPTEESANPLRHMARARAMLADLAAIAARRSAHDTATARASAGSGGLPEYFTQDFHFQTGGYLTEGSAQLYDTQVETLFMGGAGAMRREALRPIADFMHGRDQRRVALLDVGCGTGRFLRDLRLAYPALGATGLDLSQPYLDEARRHMRPLKPVQLVAANAEAMPFSDRSFDIVVTIFLFHELPPQVRRRVAAEMVRVLKPGGLLVFIDSLQMGDRPGWDGLLEAFPVRFHEPYFRHYAVDDLDGLFADAGLEPEAAWTSFFSKVIVRRRAV